MTRFGDPEIARHGLQIPSQLVAERVGLPYWIGFLMVGWGITATLMGSPATLSTCTSCASSLVSSQSLALLRISWQQDESR